jgi:small GTP-binding protein
MAQLAAQDGPEPNNRPAAKKSADSIRDSPRLKIEDRRSMRKTKVKVILLGDTTDGKTSIVRRQALNSFEFKMVLTVGIDHLSTDINVGNQVVRLMLWDTAGQEQFAPLVPICIRGAQVCIIVGSIVDPESCEHVLLWHQRLSETGENASVILAINKMDLLDGAPQTIEEIRARYQGQFPHLFFVSAKTGDSIAEMFHQAALLALESGHTSVTEPVPMPKEPFVKECC